MGEGFRTKGSAGIPNNTCFNVFCPVLVCSVLYFSILFYSALFCCLLMCYVMLYCVMFCFVLVPGGIKKYTILGGFRGDIGVYKTAA